MDYPYFLILQALGIWSIEKLNKARSSMEVRIHKKQGTDEQNINRLNQRSKI